MTPAETPLSWHAALTTWSFSPVTDAIAVLLAIWYLAGIRRTAWPRSRTCWFLTGLVVAVVVMDGFVNAYSHVLFSMHMIQHLVLITVVPALLVLGRPLELAASSVRPRTRRALVGLRANPIVSFLTHPLAAFCWYAAILAGTHLTPFMQVMLTHRWLHTVEQLLYLVGGYLFLLPLLVREPVRWRMPHLLRLALLLVGMVVDAVVGVALMMTPYEPFPAYAAQHRTWGLALLDDLHWGGAIMWVGGDALMAALAIVVISGWSRGSAGGDDLGSWLEGARRRALAGTDPDGAIATAADLDSDDEALRAYNAMLSDLHRRPD